MDSWRAKRPRHMHFMIIVCNYCCFAFSALRAFLPAFLTIVSFIKCHAPHLLKGNKPTSPPGPFPWLASPLRCHASLSKHLTLCVPWPSLDRSPLVMSRPRLLVHLKPSPTVWAANHSGTHEKADSSKHPSGKKHPGPPQR